MTLKHNLKQLIPLTQSVARKDAIQVLNDIFDWAKEFEKELEQLKQSLEKDKVMMKPYRCTPHYIEGKIAQIVEVLG